MLEDAAGQGWSAPPGCARTMTARAGAVEQRRALRDGAGIVGKGIVDDIRLLGPRGLRHRQKAGAQAAGECKRESNSHGVFRPNYRYAIYAADSPAVKRTDG